MPPSELERICEQALGHQKEAHLLRTRRAVERVTSTHVRIEGRNFVNFSSNDYLGLSNHPAIKQAIARATESQGAGSGASALMTGYTTELRSAEEELARWKGTESAVLLPSGYQANHAAVQTLTGAATAAGKDVRFLFDKLVHASLIDAVRAGEKAYRVFPHNDLEKLQRLLTDADPNQLQVVITESIFSMDGDSADLRALAQLKEQQPFVLLLDEAHGTGVYGKNGSGYAAEMNLSHAVDISIVTLSKAMGTVGGAVCASTNFCSAVANFGRAYIYSTALPASAGAACVAAIEVMKHEPDRQQRIKQLAQNARQGLTAANFQIPPGDSPIIPIIVGDESRALRLSQHLYDKRMLVTPVRPPTVPKGASRLRITLSCAHTEAEISHLMEALKKEPM